MQAARSGAIGARWSSYAVFEIFSGTLFRIETGMQNRTEKQNLPVRKTVLLRQYGKPHYLYIWGEG
jgi:hypothetical protein